jgi:hypothetical protein
MLNLVHRRLNRLELFLLATTMDSTVCILQSTFYSLHSTVYILHSTFYILHSSVYLLQSTFYSLHSKFCSSLT